MKVWAVWERDGTSIGAIPTLAGYVLAETKEEAREKAGEPDNSWHSYEVSKLKEIRRD